jgi:3-hydroxyacyl-[acyl-carrier-protein] dehydratase
MNVKLPTIEEALPHRPPFLFIDQIVEVTSEKVIARRTVREDEPQFQGHYPGRPIMPGVLLCETVMQAGCYLMVARMGGELLDGVPVVTRMNEVKFKRMVKPGDVLEIFCEHVETKMGVHFLKGQIKVEGKLAASLEFAVTIAPEVI